MRSIFQATFIGLSLTVGSVAMAYSPMACAATTESAGQYVSSSALTAQVKAALLGTKGIDSNDISVQTTGTVVTLTGSVDNAAQVELAQRVAAGVEGVTQVQNNLTSP